MSDLSDPVDNDTEFQLKECAGCGHTRRAHHPGAYHNADQAAIHRTCRPPCPCSDFQDPEQQAKETKTRDAPGKEVDRLKAIAEWLIAEEHYKGLEYAAYWIYDVLPHVRRNDTEFLRREREQNQQLRRKLADHEIMLSNVREMHKKTRGDGWRCSTDAWYCGWCLTGNHDEPVPWPCETAELVFTPEELA